MFLNLKPVGAPEIRRGIRRSGAWRIVDDQSIEFRALVTYPRAEDLSGSCARRDFVQLLAFTPRDKLGGIGKLFTVAVSKSEVPYRAEIVATWTGDLRLIERRKRSARQ
jgi:hypothetical protein